MAQCIRCSLCCGGWHAVLRVMVESCPTGNLCSYCPRGVHSPASADRFHTQSLTDCELGALHHKGHGSCNTWPDWRGPINAPPPPWFVLMRGVFIWGADQSKTPRTPAFACGPLQQFLDLMSRLDLLAQCAWTQSVPLPLLCRGQSLRVCHKADANPYMTRSVTLTLILINSSGAMGCYLVPIPFGRSPA